jgi:hypothetical protein
MAICPLKGKLLKPASGHFVPHDPVPAVDDQTQQPAHPPWLVVRGSSHVDLSITISKVVCMVTKIMLVKATLAATKPAEFGLLAGGLAQCLQGATAALAKR